MNGNIVDDQNYQVKSGDKIIIDKVRAYQLPEYCRTLRLREDERVETTTTKKIPFMPRMFLWFNDSGICDMRESQFDVDDFIKYVDDTFVQGIIEKKID